MILSPDASTLIARDRSDRYADGATRGAPEAVQVADRFHLLKNLGDALERFLQQKRSLIKQATTPTVAPLPTPRLQPWQKRMECESEQRHAPWIARYEQVIALRAMDAAIADIARAVGNSGTTVYRYLRLGCPPERKQYRPRCTPLDPYKEHLLRRWDEGCHVATRLWREIRAMGYTSDGHFSVFCMSRPSRTQFSLSPIAPDAVPYRKIGNGGVRLRTIL